MNEEDDLLELDCDDIFEDPENDDLIIEERLERDYMDELSEYHESPMNFYQY